MRERHEDRADAALGALLEMRGVAPPISPVFLGAVRKRRVARRIRVAGMALGTLVIAASAWTFVMQRSGLSPGANPDALAIQDAASPELTLPTLAALRSQGLLEFGAVALIDEDPRQPLEPLRAGDSVDSALMDRVLRGL